MKPRSQLAPAVNFVLTLLAVIGCALFGLWLAVPAKAAAKPVTHILAVHFFNEAESKPPYMLLPFTDGEACLKEADKRNRTDEQMRRDDLRAMGAEYVCLKIERVTV